MPFEAIYRLTEHLTPESKVFEWGMGGSTLFLLDHAGEVVSVEHDQGWFDSLFSKLDQHSNWSGLLAVPVDHSTSETVDPSDPKSYGSSAEEFRSHRFHEYVHLIDTHEDESFDLVIVDGRSRPSCAMHAQPKINVGGLVVIDNADRKQYHRIHEMYADRETWDRIDCSGPSPYSSLFTGNVIYRKRKPLEG